MSACAFKRIFQLTVQNSRFFRNTKYSALYISKSSIQNTCSSTIFNVKSRHFAERKTQTQRNGINSRGITLNITFAIAATWNSLKSLPSTQNTSEVKAMAALSPLDPSSFSRPELAIVRHISLNLSVDFEEKILSGSAILSIDVLDDVNEVILDVSGLKIESVESEDGTALKYTDDSYLPNFGSKLTIKLPNQTGSGENTPVKSKTKAKKTKDANTGTNDGTDLCTKLTFSGYTYEANNYIRDVKVQVENDDCCGCKDRTATGVNFKYRLKLKIKYKTSPTASALQWLDPNQTSGKKYPYLFSQCQPIHARSIVPCQDSPAVKFTYDAEISAPEEFTILMSALRGDVRGNKTYFNQPMPLPAYLLAIAVGVLESKSIGPRSKVWAEKDFVGRSAWEFGETEKYLQTAEHLCGPYEWHQYDLLVMPPSFPYGGMENPCLTFVTPTLLAGDRSLANVIVHEIMHSWTGNLVTNRNFEHFWLNEGFTVYLERKVGAALVADPIESARNRDFQSLLGLQELNETINSELGADNPYTQLVPDLSGVHPDDAFSRVPYEKGSLFLRYLEDLLGGPETFDGFLRAYLMKYRKKSLDTDQFKAFLLDYFKNDERLKGVDWNTWLYKTGMPPVIPNYDNSKTKAVTSLVGKLTTTNSTIDASDVKSFCPHQMIYLLQSLVTHTPALPLEKVHEIGKVYKVAESHNAEIEYRWLRLCIRSKDPSILKAALDFVNNQGRMKYVRPLYRDLYAWEDVRKEAIDNFLANEKYMMHVTAYMLRKDLHLSS